MTFLFYERNRMKYKPKACVCAKCAEPGATPIVFKPTCGPQRVAPECLSAEQKRKRAVGREWARKKAAQKTKAPQGPKKKAAHIGRTPIKRCGECCDQSWRRPKSGCPGCGFCYAPEEIDRS